MTDYDNNRIRTCTSLGLVSTLAGTGSSGNVDGAASTATFAGPWGIVMDSFYQFLYVTCYVSHTLRQVGVTTGFTITLAGSGVSGRVDGTGLFASFNQPAYAR